MPVSEERLRRWPPALAGLLASCCLGCADAAPSGDANVSEDGVGPEAEADAVPDVAPDEGGGVDGADAADESGAEEAADGTDSEDAADVPVELTWRELGRQETTRFVSGAVFGGRIYGGTHLGGSSAIYDYPPFRQQQVFGGESVLDFCAFAGSLYTAHENGPRIYRLAGEAWELAHDHGDGWVYMFFLTVFHGALLATGGTADSVVLLGTDDGATFSELAVLPGWNWLPVEYRDALYLLGHDGAAYAAEPASGYVSPDGRELARVDALTGGPEYQCACVWNDVLYLGTGGWTNDRGSDSSALIHAFDGTLRTQVFDTDKNGVTDIIVFRDTLYATVDSGWERPAGDSRLYQSADGATWSLVRTFPDPELRHLEVVDDSALVVFGGQAGGYGVIYVGE